MPKQHPFTLHAKDGREVALPLMTFVVERTEGDRLWTTVGGVSVWCPSSAVVAVADGLNYFNGVIRQGRGDAYAYAARAMLWNVEKKDVDRALADLDEAIRLAPDNALIHQWRGKLRSVRKEYDAAIADYTRSIELAPDMADAHQGRGHVYKARRQFDRAIADFARAVKLEPDGVVHYHDLGRAYEAAGRHDEAIAEYNKALRLDPANVYSFNNRALAYLAKGDRKRAIADFNRAVQLDPSYRNAVYSRGVAYMLARQENAIHDANTAIRLAGRDDASAIYAALTGYFAGKQLRKDRQAASFLDVAAGRAKSGAWPAPIVGHLRGQIDENLLLSAAQDDGQKTEAHCYIGLQALVNDREQSARTHLGWVKENGLPEYTETSIAVGELQRLDRQNGGAPATSKAPSVRNARKGT